MAARLTEDLKQRRACSVNDRRLLRETRSASHVPRHGQHPLDAIESPERLTQYGEGVEGAHSGRGRALLDADIDAQCANAGEDSIDAG